MAHDDKTPGQQNDATERTADSEARSSSAADARGTSQRPDEDGESRPEDVTTAIKTESDPDSESPWSRGGQGQVAWPEPPSSGQPEANRPRYPDSSQPAGPEASGPAYPDSSRPAGPAPAEASRSGAPESFRPGAPAYPGEQYPGTQPFPPAGPYPGGGPYPQPFPNGGVPYPGAPAGPPPYPVAVGRPGGPPPGTPPPPGFPGFGPPPETKPRPARGGGDRPRPRWLGAAAIALVAGLLGALVGGYVGVRAGGSDSVLNSALPGIGTSSEAETAVEGVAKRVLPSVVQIRLRAGNKAGAGSGIVLTQDGLILTNNHVVEDAANGAGKLTVLFQNSKRAEAQIVGRDPTSDVAVIRALNVNGLSPIALGNSDEVRVGQQVVAIGSPLGLGGTVTTGIVSAVNRAVSIPREEDPNAKPEVLDAIQTDAAINPGNSGGPLVDIDGRLIGMNTAIASLGGGRGDQGGSVGLGFAIPINQARRISDELQRTGQATMPLMGVSVGGPTQGEPTDLEPGARVAAVAPPDGPAGKAGLKPGDLVVKINDRAITTPDELVAAVRSRAPGDTITVVLSDGRTFQVVLGGEPAR
ncbi:hypothetical protein GCM10023321_18040 [Pseudonocardia eucalypti]|uniref:PDZ domain-containing protein n=1 Tax=Pseudonocardia eucalypti TaxID=648755 RepID=A0ABP9PUN9_9PSEU|nr:putative serine protease PepD [Pseudonocardia eucalypti]